MLTSHTLSWTARTVLIAALAIVCAPRLAAGDGTTAVLMVQTGQVSKLTDGRAIEPLYQGVAIHRHELIMTGPDSYAKFQLPDGSTWEVFSNAKVVFDYVPGVTDFLNVIIGRIKVFIDHSRGPNYKNVSTPTAVISVRGTVFDVDVQDDDGTTFVTVDEGLVTVKNLTAPGGWTALRPGDSITVYRGQQLVGKQVDPHSIYRAAIKSAQQALYQMIYGRPGGVGGPIGNPGTNGPSPGQGDKGGKTPPPPPPPPPAKSGGQ
jgi:hypothetical protein